MADGCGLFRTHVSVCARLSLRLPVSVTSLPLLRDLVFSKRGIHTPSRYPWTVLRKPPFPLALSHTHTLSLSNTEPPVNDGVSAGDAPAPGEAQHLVGHVVDRGEALERRPVPGGLLFLLREL